MLVQSYGGPYEYLTCMTERLLEHNTDHGDIYISIIYKLFKP